MTERRAVTEEEWYTETCNMHVAPPTPFKDLPLVPDLEDVRLVAIGMRQHIREAEEGTDPPLWRRESKELDAAARRILAALDAKEER